MIGPQTRIRKRNQFTGISDKAIPTEDLGWVGFDDEPGI